MTELPLPSVMVIDPHTYRYFLPENAEDPQAIIRLLDDILKNDPEPSSYGGNTFFYRIYRYDSIFEVFSNSKEKYLQILFFFVNVIRSLTCVVNFYKWKHSYAISMLHVDYFQ